MEAKNSHNQGQNKNRNNKVQEKKNNFKEPRRNITYKRIEAVPVYRNNQMYYRNSPSPITIRFDIGSFLFYYYSNAVLYERMANKKGHKTKLYQSNSRWIVNIR